MENKTSKYMNPYLAGVLLGLVLLAAFYFTGRGLGASGAVKSTIVTVVGAVAPEHAAESHFYGKYSNQEESPIKTWLVFEIIGVLFGALISGTIAGRLKLKIEHSPKINSSTRLYAAAIGGLLFGLGSQLGRGCTSGAALSGMASLSTAGFISMMAIFGTAYMFAYIFRKLWI
ncbi:MAG: YeeE/YedE thiosulfate transporter family protein [Bacteroidota bacterium]|nr:YeeE/YedE thiosulfate transporter family protein [Bacteroidota bacterium]